MNRGRYLISSFLLLACTVVVGQEDSTEQPTVPIHREDGKVVVASGTLMCTTHYALKKLQTAIYENDKSTEQWLVRSGACTITDSTYKFHDLASYDQGTLQSVTPIGLSGKKHFICRYSYQSSLTKYLEQTQPKIQRSTSDLESEVTES